MWTFFGSHFNFFSLNYSKMSKLNLNQNKCHKMQKSKKSTHEMYKERINTEEKGRTLPGKGAVQMAFHNGQTQSLNGIGMDIMVDNDDL